MSDEWEARRRWLLISAVGLDALLLIGMAAGAIWIRPGTALPLDQRLEYLGARPIGWTLTWSSWMVAAIAEIVFIFSLARCLQHRAADLALKLVVGGVSVDLFCQALQVTVVPRLAAQPGAVGAFLALEGVCVVGSMVIGPALYTLAVAAVTSAFPRRDRWVRLTAWPTIVGGALMTASGFTTNAYFMGGATIVSLGTYCAWALAVTRAVLVDVMPKERMRAA